MTYCAACQSSFDNIQELADHFRSLPAIHGQFKCETCKVETGTEKDLKYHMYAQQT